MMYLGIEGSTLPKSRICFADNNLATDSQVLPCTIFCAAGRTVDVLPVSPVKAVPSAASMITSSIALPIAIAAA